MCVSMERVSPLLGWTEAGRQAGEGRVSGGGGCGPGGLEGAKGSWASRVMGRGASLDFSGGSWVGAGTETGGCCLLLTESWPLGTTDPLLRGRHAASWVPAVAAGRPPGG